MSVNAGKLLLTSKGVYSASTTYASMDYVTYQKSVYVAKKATTGNLPTDTEYWDFLAKTESELSEMTDVSLSSLADGQTILYDTASGKWKNGSVEASLASMSDVQFEDLSDGDILTYDAESEKWINKSLLEIVTWTDGTDEQLAAMLDAHYKGLIDINDYWKVGDERKVNLSAMEAIYVEETHIAQTITMVLMNSGGKTLVNPINGISECAFVVGQKAMLGNSLNPEYGGMNLTRTSKGGWDACVRRAWCNNIYRMALPEMFRSLFKLHQNETSSGNAIFSSTVIVSEDYFALPAEKEVFVGASNADYRAEANNSQFEYYKISANRIKARSDINSSPFGWWNRSPRANYDTSFCYVDYRGYRTTGQAVETEGIAPFGVI